MPRKQINLRLTDQEKAAYQICANAAGTDLSKWIRNALNEAVKNQIKSEQ